MFTSPLVIARDFSGCVEHLTHVEPTSATTITCVPRLEPLETMQLRPQATRFGGRVTTETVGNGVEFYTVRDYQPSGPRSRINWNQLAKTGELSTLQFREERIATVVLVIDARTEAVLAPESDGQSAVDRSVTAAGRIFATLHDGRTSVGIAALSAHPETFLLVQRRVTPIEERADSCLQPIQQYLPPDLPTIWLLGRRLSSVFVTGFRLMRSLSF